jgi:hypothetical protein
MGCPCSVRSAKGHQTRNHNLRLLTIWICRYGGMADTTDLKSVARHGRPGSSPGTGTARPQLRSFLAIIQNFLA